MNTDDNGSGDEVPDDSSHEREEIEEQAEISYPDDDMKVDKETGQDRRHFKKETRSALTRRDTAWSALALLIARQRTYINSVRGEEARIRSWLRVAKPIWGFTTARMNNPRFILEEFYPSYEQQEVSYIWRAFAVADFREMSEKDFYEAMAGEVTNQKTGQKYQKKHLRDFNTDFGPLPVTKREKEGGGSETDPDGVGNGETDPDDDVDNGTDPDGDGGNEDDLDGDDEEDYPGREGMNASVVIEDDSTIMTLPPIGHIAFIGDAKVGQRIACDFIAIGGGRYKIVDCQYD